MPTPARRATSSVDAASPPAPNTSRAASRIRARLDRASARWARAQSVCDHRLDVLPGLYAEHTHVIHPFDPQRSPALTTRRELAEHFRRGGEARNALRIQFQPAAITVHLTADPEVVIGEFEYRGARPDTGEPFAMPAIFVLRVRDGQIVESRDYFDHVASARVFGRSMLPGANSGAAAAGAASTGEPAGGDAAGGDAAGGDPAGGDPAGGDPAGGDPAAGDPAAGWQALAQRRYEDGFFGDDAAALDTGERELTAVEADLALARGRIMHARFLAGGPPDEATLRQFEHAATWYAELGDARGEAEAVFWTATFHQAVHGDHQTAKPLLGRAEKLATAAGDRLTLSYVARHLGFVAEDAGQLDVARDRYHESLRLRRELEFQRGVAAALLALAEFASRHGDRREAQDLLAEADAVAQASDADGIKRRIEHARATAAGTT